MDQSALSGSKHAPWNKGKLIGQKPPLKLKEIWATRIRLQLNKRTRELALFNLAIDSKLRGCDLVKLRVCDMAQEKELLLVPLSCSRRRIGPFSLKLLNRPEKPWPDGLKRHS